MKSKKKYSNKTKPSYITLFPIILALVIVPLIVRIKALTIPAENYIWVTSETIKLYDLFAYYKGMWLIIAALISIGIFLYYYFTKVIAYPDNKSFYLLYGYMGLVIFSYLFSINKSISYIGFHEHYENVFILLVYIVLFIYTSTFITEERQFKYTIFAWIGSITIMFLIGISQYFGHDFFFTALGKSLIVPSSIPAEQLSADKDAVRNVYQTLYHYNYVSFYAAIALPFFLVLGAFEENIKLKFLYYSVSFIMVINQLISLSRNGFIGIFVSLVFVFIFLREKVLHYWKIIIPLLAVVIISFTAFIFTSNSTVAQRIVQGLEGLTTVEDYSLNDIIAIDDTLIIDHDSYYLDIKYEPENSDTLTPFSFYDANNNPIEYTLSTEDKKYLIEGVGVNKFAYAYFTLEDMPSLEITIDEYSWVFVYTDSGFTYLNSRNTLDVIPEIERTGFEGRERFASARGYIWSRSIPLLKDYWLFGSGPDTFAFAFPQNDYVGKYNAYGTPNMIVDKPHNIYLDYAVNTGIPSLLVLLIFWVGYIVWSFRLYIKANFESYYARVGVACLTAVIGYLSSGIFNDTNQNITPVFWVILGLGFAANSLYVQNHKVN